MERAEPAAGVVLAGGRSTRMGRDKAALQWHGTSLLRRVTGLVGRAVGGEVVVVRAPGQALPPLPPTVEVVDDPAEGLGPLQGLAVGLAAAAAHGRRAAVVTATDVPLLHPALLCLLLRALGAEGEGSPAAVVPHVGGRRQPLAAAYRSAVATQAEALLAIGERRLTALLDSVAVRVLDEADLLADPAVAAVDPLLEGFANVNRPEDLAALLARRPPEVTVLVEGRPDTVATVCAATLAAAAAAVGRDLAVHRATIDGVVVDDPDTPLASGDRVVLAPVG